MGMNHRFVKGVALQLTAAINLHVADHGESVHLRLERTQTIREHLRKHRDDPLREIHRIAPDARLFI